jgi:hypothetical protein
MIKEKRNNELEQNLDVSAEELGLDGGLRWQRTEKDGIGQRMKTKNEEGRQRMEEDDRER